MFKTYVLNCFLLLLPVMVWDLVFTNRLPEYYQAHVFWNNIPSLLYYGENVSRILVFILALLMPLHITTRTQKHGVVLYVAGLLAYFASWVACMYFPDSAWSNSIYGFTAPAYTPLLWLTGIGLIGNSFYFRFAYSRWLFIGLSCLFLVFHNAHTLLIYFRTH